MRIIGFIFILGAKCLLLVVYSNNKCVSVLQRINFKSPKQIIITLYSTLFHINNTDPLQAAVAAEFTNLLTCENNFNVGLTSIISFIRKYRLFVTCKH